MVGCIRLPNLANASALPLTIAGPSMIIVSELIPKPYVLLPLDVITPPLTVTELLATIPLPCSAVIVPP